MFRPVFLSVPTPHRHMYSVKYLTMPGKVGERIFLTTDGLCVFVFQAIFDRNRKDELPGLQLEWIDGICAPLYEVMMFNNPSNHTCACCVFTWVINC